MTDDTAAPAAAPAPTAAPSAPSSPAPWASMTTADAQVLAAPTDVTEYAEAKRENLSYPENRTEEVKRRLSHHERLKRARDAAKAELAAQPKPLIKPLPDGQVEADDPREWAAQIRQQRELEQVEQGWDGAPAPEATGQEAVQQPPLGPEEAEAARQEFAERARRQVEAAAVYGERERRIAAVLPDYHDALAVVGHEAVPDHTAELLRESEYGPLIVYHLGRDEVGWKELEKLKKMGPQAAARWLGGAEAALEFRARMQSAPPPQRGRVTQARAPIAPLRGSASPTPSYADLAKSDDITAYAQHRQRQRNGQGK